MAKFKIGDSVRVAYICDCHPCNNMVGTLTWMHEYNYYPNRDESVVEKRWQGTIEYPNGMTYSVSNLYRKGSGVVSPVEIINNNEREA